MPQVVSANRLAEGTVVFLAQDDHWKESLADAQVFADKTAMEDGLSRAARAVAKNEVVDIAPMDVDSTPRGLEPRHIRDRIRAAGPTVRLDHGKQAVAV